MINTEKKKTKKGIRRKAYSIGKLIAKSLSGSVDESS
jgi:hypothetical protein